MIMLGNGKKDTETYIEGLSAIKQKYGEDVLNNELSVFRKQLLKWMNDKNSSPLLPKYIINEYNDFVDGI